MLKRKNRLSIIANRINGKKFFSPLFTARISSSDNSEARFGFIISKRIDKRAVIRNQTKRVLQKAAGEFVDSQRNKDILVIAKTKLNFTDLGKVVTEFRKILK